MTAELVREATRDGRRVALFRCFDGDDGATIVEAEVTTPAGERVRRGPYRFATAHDALRFVQEATLALQYLGCSVGGG
ncbi:MAG TPA: hypothetical protein VFA05_06300 [Gaiellaceae bacterium]|nr:hypothetical protein [Gaiellaceae bacterium]